MAKVIVPWAWLVMWKFVAYYISYTALGTLIYVPCLCMFWFTAFKLSMFCALSKKLIIIFGNIIASSSKLYEKLKNSIEISVDQAVLELLIKNNSLVILINNLRTTWPTNILKPFLSFSDNLLQDGFIFQNSVDNFEIEHKTCYILV